LLPIATPSISRHLKSIRVLQTSHRFIKPSANASRARRKNASAFAGTMLIETNYLTFLRPGGAQASVVPGDNNFAGVGAAVSGKPGERFKDVDTGVLAHLQHVLMYSTTRIPEPVAKRTRQVQDDVQDVMRRLRRPVTYSDLAREWTGSDKNNYAAEMQRMAEKYASRYCREAALKPRVSQTVASGAH
jgi:hypothetical protein